MEIGSSLSDVFFNAVFYAGERNSFAVSGRNRFFLLFL